MNKSKKRSLIIVIVALIFVLLRCIKDAPIFLYQKAVYIIIST